MNDRFLFWLVYPVIVVTVISVGWKQPLRYRFMSLQEIAALERGEIPGQPVATPAPPTPKPTPWIFEKNRGNPLESRSTR